MRKYLWLIFGGALLLLMACRVDFHTQFQTPESGNVMISWTMTAEEEQMLASMDAGSAEDLCNEMKSEIMQDEEDEATVTFHEEDDGSKVCTIQGPFASLEELQDIYGEDTKINKIGEVDGKFIYDVVVSPLDSSEAGTDMPMPIVFTWRVTMPGKVVEHNGDKIEGRTITWNIASGKPPRHIKAVSSMGGFDFTDPKFLALAGACICLPLLAVVVGLIVWLAMRRKKQGQAAAASPDVSSADWTE